MKIDQIFWMKSLWFSQNSIKQSVKARSIKVLVFSVKINGREIFVSKSQLGLKSEKNERIFFFFSFYWGEGFENEKNFNKN